MMIHAGFSRRDFLQLAAATGLVSSLPARLAAQETMMTREIPGTGEPMPVIGYGGSSVFRGSLEEGREQARELLQILVDAGGRFIDAGGNIGNNVGQWSTEMNIRDRLFLGTGLRAGSPEEVEQILEQAEQYQGKTPLDLVQVQIRNRDDMLPVWRQVIRWQEAGRLRYTGVATARADDYRLLENFMMDHHPDFVQLNYSILEPEAEQRMLPMAQDLGIAVVTNRPFINGNYFSLVKDQPLPEWAAEFDCESWAQFSLKWSIAHPAVNCTITETANPRHARDNLRAGMGRLPDAQMQQRMSALLESFA